MIYFVLSVTAMTLLAVLFRAAMVKGGTPIGFNVIFRTSTALFWGVGAWVTLDGFRLEAFLTPAGLLGAVALAAFIMSGVSAAKAVQLGPLGVSWTIMRCSMVLATFASLFYWREVTPATPVRFVARLAGVAVAVAAIILFGMDHSRRYQRPGGASGARRHLKAWFLWIAVALLAQGGWETCLRATREVCADDRARMVFLTVVFLGAGAVAVPFAPLKRTRPNRCDLLYGCLAGLAGAVGSGMRPWAIRDLGGAFVFPATAIIVTLGVQVAARVIWKERFGRLGIAATAMTIIGILLLTIRF